MENDPQPRVTLTTSFRDTPVSIEGRQVTSTLTLPSREFKMLLRRIVSPNAETEFCPLKLSNASGVAFRLGAGGAAGAVDVSA